MYTITKLAKLGDISRTTILYYEREGLLLPTLRSSNGYRWYDEQALSLLKRITSFRSFGISVADIKDLLEHNCEEYQSRLLTSQFELLEANIAELRKQQSAIVALLKQPKLLEANMVTKDRWVAIMKATGFSEEDMLNWHRNFEKMEPEEHHKFLLSLGIDEQEALNIRKL